MVIDKFINVNDNWLGGGLAPVIKIMSMIESSTDEDITIDCRNKCFLTPVSILSLIVYLSKCGRKISFINHDSYLDTLCFYSGGLRPDKIRSSEFKAIMEGYANKTFIPIINFPANAESDEKETVSTVIENIIIRQLGIQPNVATGFKYMIGETIDNISQHSETDRGFIAAQAYKNKGYLDMCIADRGISLLGSYKKVPGDEIASDDLEAIKAANSRVSSKNLPDAENRGYGIYTTKKMLIDGLGGQYMIISGSALSVQGHGFNNYYSMPGGLRWNGTIIALRIPYQAPSFNYINYIE